MLRTFSVAEMLEKKVVPFGNGSIVYTPKKWVGKTAIVILEEKPIDAREETMVALKPFFPKIEAAFLFGSFARNEERSDSDIDVLVIAQEPLPLKKTGRFDFLVKTKKELEEELQKDHSLFLHQALAEAKPILNEALLKEMQKLKTAPDFRTFFDETLGAFQNVQKLLNADKKKGNEFSTSPASVYSLVLRLKTIFLIQRWRQKKPFSNKGFWEFLQKQGFSEKTVNGFLAVYRAERDNKKTEQKVLQKDAEQLFEAAKIAFVKTEKMIGK